MWISDENIFKILEIEPTSDKKVIKKAYAKLVKKYHPEEQPEKWKEIHAAYEAAIARAEGRGQDFFSFSGKEDALSFSGTEDTKKEITAAPGAKNEKKEASRSTEESSPESVMKSGKTEMPPKTREESDELDSLFNNIGALSREQQHQNKEMFKHELQEVMDDFRKLSDKKELDLKEWKAFFSRETRLPYICTREFLGMFGDYFENRSIKRETYRFLIEQLAVITKYRQERNIVLQNIGLSDPIEYAEKKIYKAYCGPRSGNRSGTTGREGKKAVWIAMIIFGIVIRVGIKNAGRSLETHETVKIPDEVIEATIKNTMADITVENENNEDDEDYEIGNIARDDDGNAAAGEGNVTRAHIPMIPDKIQIGDSKAVMIEALGEPEEIRGSQEDTDYEEAVYASGGFGDGLVVVLENEIITDIYVEYESE